MVDCHSVAYNSNKKDAFIVHLPHKQVKFQWDPNGLYIYKPPEKPEPGTNLNPSLLILWRRTRSSIHSISSNDPSELENYFILLEPHWSVIWRPSFEWIQSRTIQLLLQISTLLRNFLGQIYLPWKGRLLTTSQYQSSKTTLRFLKN